MNLAMTLILGLFLQLTPALSGEVTACPCLDSQETCSCCSETSSCPCVADRDSDREQAPLPFDTGGSRLHIPMNPAETTVSIEVLTDGERLCSRRPNAWWTGPAGGFTGVRLAVAFCSFLI
jgi:hypothetical protein